MRECFLSSAYDVLSVPRISYFSFAEADGVTSAVLAETTLP